MTRLTRDKQAELELLELYDRTRERRGFDFGGGQRRMELGRRRRELRAELAGRELAGASADELRAAWRRVGAPRYRRAQADAERYGSKGARLTAAVWSSLAVAFATSYTITSDELEDQAIQDELEGRGVHE